MDGQPIGEFNDYAGFQRLMRARKEALQISNETLDALAGTFEGHAGKMLADPPSKNMGILTLGLLMQGLAVKGVLTVDHEQLRRIEARMAQRDEKNGAVLAVGKYPAIELRISRRRLKKLAKLGGHARAAKLSRRRRVQIAKKAIRARWSGLRPKSEARDPGRNSESKLT